MAPLPQQYVTFIRVVARTEPRHYGALLPFVKLTWPDPCCLLEMSPWVSGLGNAALAEPGGGRWSENTEG